MSRVDDLIEALMEEYFEEDSTAERYKIFEKVEKAMCDARAVTKHQIDNAEYIKEGDLLKKMSEVVSNANGNTVYLSRTATLKSILDLGQIDSLDIVEIVMEFEMILNIDITYEDNPDITIGELIDQHYDSK